MHLRHAIGVLVVLAAVAVPVNGQVRLEWKFKKDETFTVETKQTQNQNVEIMGQKVTMEVVTTTRSTYKVLGQTKEGTELEQKIDSVVVKSTGGFGGGGMDKMAEQLKGATFRFILTPKGEVTKLDGYEDLLKKVSGGSELTDKMVRATLTEEAIKQMVGEAFSYLPATEVKEGSKWQRMQTVPLGPLGSFTAVHDYTLAKATKETAEIDVTSTMKYKAPDDKSAGLFKITKADLEAKSATSQIVFNLAAGRLTSINAKLQMEGTMTIEASGMTILMKLDSVQSTTVTVK
jgi:hypothetical protein